MEQKAYQHANQILKSAEGHSLWVGDFQSAENVPWLQEHHIKTVFTAAAGFKMRYGKDIKHITYGLTDHKSQNISSYFDMAAYQISKSLKSGSVLVHCGAGVSRSPSLVIAFLIRYHAMTFHEALLFCREKRSQICPNLGFQYQLKDYSKKRIAAKKSSTDLSLHMMEKKIKFPNLYNSQLEKGFSQRANSNQMRVTQITPKSNANMIFRKRSTMDRGCELQWLKKLAQFRFGETNAKKWHLNGQAISLPHRK